MLRKLQNGNMVLLWSGNILLILWTKCYIALFQLDLRKYKQIRRIINISKNWNRYYRCSKFRGSFCRSLSCQVLQAKNTFCRRSPYYNPLLGLSWSVRILFSQYWNNLYDMLDSLCYLNNNWANYLDLCSRGDM